MAKKDIYAEIADVCEDQRDELFKKPNVVGVAAGNKIIEAEDRDTGEPCITLLVSHKLEKSELSSKDMIAKTVQGVKTDVIETGEIFAGYDPDDDAREGIAVETLRQRIRPAMGGFSVGHPKITAGTIATCVYDMKPFPGIPRRYYILSNNHVLANSNNAQIGDPILQPGSYDGGTYPADVIARLSGFVPIKFKTPTSIPLNYVDAAIAEGEFHNLNREIFWIGYVKQVNSNPKVGMLVEKTGRTTNFTTGKILALSATIDVNYGGGKVARFARQIVTTNMSAGGDSGSLVCDISEGAVALLFAGSSSVTIASPITYVQSALGIRLHP